MEIINICINMLSITRPYKIELLSSSNVESDALYWPVYSDKKGKLTHNIRVYLGNKHRTLEALIAHEFIHAWQEEQKLIEIHGPKFIAMARELEEHIGISGIYNKETDS